MSLNFNQLQKLVTDCGLQFFVDPNNCRLLLGATGLCGSYQVVVSLYDDGAFLQFRTVHYLTCPDNDPRLLEVLRAMADMNYYARLVKLAWDHSDGEIVAYADTWVMDGTVTPGQMDRLFRNFLSGIDLHYYRLQKTLKDGKDPGRLELCDVARALHAEGRLPAGLEGLMEQDGPGPSAAKTGPSIEQL